MKKFEITACGKEREMQLTAKERKHPPSCDCCDCKKTYKEDAKALRTFIGNLPHATVVELQKLFFDNEK